MNPTSFQAKAMRWILKAGNILDEPADVLICSANVSLNLSGGVGSDLLARYGSRMQSELHKMIAERLPRAAQPGEVFAYAGPEIPYRAILHAVAIDGWYHTTPAVVRETIETAFGKAMEFSAQKVALTALATGFGDLTLNDFTEAIRPLLNREYYPIAEITICLMEDYRLDQLADALFGANRQNKS